MINLSHDVCDLLQAKACDGRNASEIVENMFAKIIATLRRDPRFTNIPVFEFELMFADVRNEAETALFNETYAQVSLDEAEDAVHCVLGEPDAEDPRIDPSINSNSRNSVKGAPDAVTPATAVI